MIIARDFLIYLFGLFRIHFFYEFGRHSCIDTPRFHFRMTQYNRSGSHNCPFTNYSVIKHH